MAQVANGQWSFPLEETTGNARPPPNRHDTFGSQESGNSGYREGKNKRRPSDAYNIISDSEGAKQRQPSLRVANSKKRSRNTLREKSGEKHEDVDDSAWIHRDKLEQIEIQEMEEAGIPVPQSRRSSDGLGHSTRSSRSVSRSRGPMSRDGHVTEEPHGPAYPGFEDFERKRVSTIPAADEEDQDFDPQVDTEFRTAEEVAAEHEPVRQQVIRPSTSRIPISKISPVPVPQNVVDRDSPLPRSRHGSGANSGTWDEMQYARRARSSSIGSQVMLDEEGSRPASSQKLSSNENSPPKARVPSKTQGVRNSSTNGSTTQRPSSGTSGKPQARVSSTSQRPPSRSEHKSRPSTSHQRTPEGEAPWIAGMYKPDPRLPPDQQMLPTHAKRMMQEQWEKEGRTGTAYDRDLRPLNSNEFPRQRPRPAEPIREVSKQTMESDTGLSPKPQELEANSPGSQANLNPWSPSLKSDSKSDTGSVRPGTSGGYKITPTIASPPEIKRTPTSRSAATGQNPTPPPKVPVLSEKDEPQPKKGCGCCIVM